MDFYWRKLLGSLSMPLPLMMVLILIGFIIAWRWKKSGLIIVAVGWVGLFLFGTTPLANWITEGLENDYQPLLTTPAQAANKIVVLGGGVRSKTTAKAPANTQLASSSLSRLIEGIRVYRQLLRKGRHPKLILSGGTVFNSPRIAGIMRNTAVMLGIPKQDLILERGSRNTQEEAKFLRRQLGKRPFVLVTSATHMRRSLAIFKYFGMQPIPAPTQFLAGANRYSIGQYMIPRASNLTRSDMALHEYIGLIWAHLNNEI